MQKNDPSDVSSQLPATTAASQPKQDGQINSTVNTVRQPQALTNLTGQQATIGVVQAVGGQSLPTVSFQIPSGNIQSGQTLQLSTASLSNTQLVSPQTINIIQRQLSSGVVGLSAVTPQSLQQVLQAAGSPLTLVNANSPEAAAAIKAQQQTVQLLQKQQSQQIPNAGSQSSSGTFHHLAKSGQTNPHSNLNQPISISLLSTTMSGVSAAGVKRPLSEASTTTAQTSIANISSTSSSSQSNLSGSISGPLAKKIKLEEKPVPSNDSSNLRQSVIRYKREKMKRIRSRYKADLTELFYLQGGGNLIEFNAWKKKPSQPLKNFLEESRLDSEGEEEDLQEQINEEITALTSVGGNSPLATSVTSCTTIPPVTPLSQQAMNSTSSTSSLTAVSTSGDVHTTTKNVDVKPNIQALKNGSSHSHQIPSKSIKPGGSPGRGRQSISSVYETVTGGSQDVIVERAKQEAQVLQRVAELRKEGLWSSKRLPRVQEPPRQKAHWDYLLEEMTWLAADFIQERKWKKAASKKIARMVSNHFKEQEQKELRAEKEEAIKLKKIASQMAKMVKEFWVNIEKVVQYKQTTRLDEKKKKALDLHLNFIVDQTEKYSSWLTAGLQTDESRTPSLASDGENSIDSGDVEFQPVGTASDDEETIEREEIESGADEDATKQEVEALHRESDMPLEELLKTLPKEMLEKPSSDLQFGNEDSGSEESVSSQGKDGDFKSDDEDEEDVEDTIEEQEKNEKDYTVELDDLKAEGEMSVEELMKKYSGAYDSDFEMPEESSDDGSDDNEESSESEKESEESSNEEEASDAESKEGGEEKEKQEDMGLEFLVKKEDQGKPKVEESNTEGPGQEFNSIAAAAQSLQPKGYTLETTEVKTKVPFLLKHSLREYQHVGLDWLATMYEKRLNGILADEMGLGKTIQTIALLAHLVCEKGIWGPHLIVVPTSVMLNWEMEIKKWCPAFKILTYYGSIKERKLKRTGWTKTNAFHICITSYKLVVQDHQAFRRKKWKYFILDEAQNIKNFKSQRWQMLLNFQSQRRLLLTGTPLQNSLMELWSLMHFLMPNVFQSHSEFKEWFSNPLTGMIEGSQEYNESLVRRLHKVLRPFLLRRLKNEVEKQMPQKFEHVVMCRLSKRQRYLYDDFMSQTKTKDTLSSGHFMSVINILMQLRKVCNHPNLFDPRPVVSPFKMEGIVYKTASLASKVFERDPFKDIDIYSLYPNLAEMETDLPGFVAQRVKQTKATKKLIEEVDNSVDPPPRPPVGQLKNIRAAVSAFSQTGKVAPIVVTSSTTPSLPASPLTSVVKTTATSQQSTPTSVNSIKLLLPPSSSSTTGTQQTILIPNPSGSGPPLILPLSGSSITSSSSATSAAIASAKLISSQLQSGILQLVQTSSGHQILTTANTTSASTSTPSTVTTTSSTSLSLLKLSSVLSQSKPVMRVSPFVVSTSDTTCTVSSVPQNSSLTSAMSTTTTPTPKIAAPPLIKPVPKKPMKRSELFLESLFRKKEQRRQHVLSHMAKLNHKRCDVSPALGPDVHHVADCIGSLDHQNISSSSSIHNRIHDKNIPSWHCGYVDCLFAQNRLCNHSHPALFWKETTHLQNCVKSPEEWLHHLQDILSRYVFVTPTVISPAVSMRVSHPCLSSESELQWLETRLRPAVLKGSTMLHPIQARTSVTFPELRLIQYDCGKLQTLDRLLRQLKSGQHRVLIFTQMTKMLDVLEAFLNFHGHRYLRLDGTTRVEQRQYLMDRFNADPRIFCFILSTRSGGVGVNLTGADTVVFYDSDWNPTMDAQAQDRCHRIGQTRDVHIYRLVSEMTVEENILKKANQKRLLGDMAIEGGNFTTAFFKQQTINDLFAEPSGLQSLADDKEQEKKEKEKLRIEMEKEKAKEREKQKSEASKKSDKAQKSDSKKDTLSLTQFEQALCEAEDETDAKAAQLVKAEQKAELAEFDENIPWDEREAELRREEEVSKVELELAMIDKELTPIERYAVSVVEAQTEPETAEELKMAEEDIENSKKDWELARLKALKEEEERKAELEEDEMLYIYSKDETQVKKKGRKPLKKQNAQTPQGKGGKASQSGSDLDDSFLCKSLNGRRLSDRTSPQKPSPRQIGRVPGSPEKKKGVKTGKAGKPNTDKKVKGASITPAKKAQNVPKGKVKAENPEANMIKKVAKIVLGKIKPEEFSKKIIVNGVNDHTAENSKEKKGKAASGANTTTPVSVHLQNGHSPGLVPLSPKKMLTQAKNALLKQQALQAARITIGSASNITPGTQVRLQGPTSSKTTNSPISLPQKQQLVRPSTPKSPPDPNVPPPWSNPNLVIRTRKAAVHSPVILSQIRTARPQTSAQGLQQTTKPTVITYNAPITISSRPQGPTANRLPVAINSLPVSISNLAATSIRPSNLTATNIRPGNLTATNIRPATTNIRPQVLTSHQPQIISSIPQIITSIRPPGSANTIAVTLAGTSGGITKVHGTPDRNIFQLFTPNNSSGGLSISGMTLNPNIRQVGPVVGGTQLRTATLINPASIVNASNLAGARLINAGVAGQSSAVVVSAPKPISSVVNSSLSNFTLVPTVINASGGQTIINPTSINATGQPRSILNTTRFTNPITLQGLRTLPVGVNVLKTNNTSISLPIRPQQILQSSSLAQVPGQGYVLITPRAVRAPTPGGTSTPVASGSVQRLPAPIPVIQTLPTQNSQQTRILLAPLPAGATVVSPQKMNNITSPQTPKNNGS